MVMYWTLHCTPFPVCTSFSGAGGAAVEEGDASYGAAVQRVASSNGATTFTHVFSDIILVLSLVSDVWRKSDEVHVPVLSLY